MGLKNRTDHRERWSKRREQHMKHSEARLCSSVGRKKWVHVFGTERRIRCMQVGDMGK